jgi:hypothetical protein
MQTVLTLVEAEQGVSIVRAPVIQADSSDARNTTGAAFQGVAAVEGRVLPGRGPRIGLTSRCGNDLEAIYVRCRAPFTNSRASRLAYINIRSPARKNMPGCGQPRAPLPRKQAPTRSAAQSESSVSLQTLRSAISVPSVPVANPHVSFSSVRGDLQFRYYSLWTLRT